MTIEINGSSPTPPQAAGVTGNGTVPTQNEPRAKAAGTDNTGARDTVSLTSTAQHLRHIEQSLASQPVVDVHRVEATKQAIENGTYQIDPSRIASKMIDLERALSGAR